MSARMEHCPDCGAVLGKGRSLPDHRRFFGLIRAAYLNWPEAHPHQFANEEFQMRTNSTKIRRACFDRWKFIDALTGRVMLQCHICDTALNPANETWEAEHVVRRSVGVTPEDIERLDGTDNVRPAHTLCHTPKTAKDVAENAKGKRISDRHFGIKRPSRPMLGSRDSPFKKKMDGSVERR